MVGTTVVLNRAATVGHEAREDKQSWEDATFCRAVSQHLCCMYDTLASNARQVYNGPMSLRTLGERSIEFYTIDLNFLGTATRKASFAVPRSRTR